MQICNSTADLHKFWNVLDVVLVIYVREGAVSPMKLF